MLAGCIAGATVLYVTRPPAPGITGDSVFYLSGAEALATSGKLAYATQAWRATDSLTPMTRVMPGLAVAIAAGRLAGVSAVAAARVVQALSAFAIAFAVAWLAYSVAGPVTAALLIASVLVLPTFLYVHLYVLTEPLFLVCLITALLLMTREEPRPLALGMAAALATAVRYPGVALTMTVCLWMLLRPDRFTARLRRAVIAGVPTAVLLALWILHTRSAETAEPIREFGVYGGLGTTFRDGLLTIGAWAAPGSRPIVRLVLAIGLLVALVLAIVHTTRTYADPTSTDTQEAPRRRAIAAALLFIACYAAVVIASRVFADPFIEFRARMLLPALIFGQIAVALLLADWLRSRGVVPRVAVVALIALWLAVSARVSRGTIVRERAMGLDVARPAVGESRVLQWLRENADNNRLIVSNHPLAVYHFLARDARWWPAHTSPDTIRDFAAVVRARNGLVVSFAAHDQWITVADDSALVRALGLRPVAHRPDGTVWEIP